MKKLLLVVIPIVALSGCEKPAENGAEPQAAADESAAGSAPVQLESGLQIEKIKNGYGRAVGAGDRVEVHYTGWLYDEGAADNRGEKFDSSIDRGDMFPFQIGVSRVIQGWHDGVEGMLIGEKRVLTIPPELGYGANDYGPIPGGSTLIFEIELFSAEAAEAPQD
ncbi:MAG: FKBP-type peptidyl-prolyl cis-trans isomerase [Woeseiaceae bacterium]